jgi:threonine/homoserine/homoserine lactone efflux protein
VAATILIALILGTFAGLAPGPYTTMVAGTALEQGFTPAARLALAPLVADLPPLVVTALILKRLSGGALMALGIIGGLMILYIGSRFLLRWRAGELPLDPDHPDVPRSARFWHVAVATAVSPVPWIFWLVVGSPLMLRSWSHSAAEGLLFIAIVFVTNIVTAIGLAWTASHGRKLLSARWQRRVLGGVGGVLVFAGVVLIYQAATGDFERLVERQAAIRSMVEERLPDR